MCQYALSTGICHDKINTYWFQCQYINTPLNFQIIYVFGQSFSTYFNLMYRYLIHVDNFFLFYKRLLKLFLKVFLSQKSLENFKSYTFTCNISKIVEAEKFSMRRINVADGSSYFNKIVCNSKNKSELSIHIILGQGEIDLRLNSFGWISSYIYQMHAGLNCLSCSLFIPK